ncbi:response regulator transcription factor [Brevibacillus humidisoli]|uniref:response regulator transcription factor n=1 Tax=Brevibacillus humidisoli TaxID=2895522 RepID=UPI001E4FA7BC|nr:response regulator transcription factor [Brevibacillus humidisoli]UFJ39440.1 response regulator transcription factor [Brevibacillus humidisoli]
MSCIKIFLCDDDPLFCELLVRFLDKEPEFQVIGQAADKESLLRAVTSHSIDILLLDNHLTHSPYDGIEAAIEIRASFPAMPIIVLSSLDDAALVAHAVAYGRVTNYITKEHYRDLPQAIRTAHAKQPSFHHSTTGVLINQFIQAYDMELRRQITPIQLEILKLLDQGYNRRQIADKLYYAEQTINNELCKLSAVIKGRFPYLQWLRLKKHNTKRIVQLAKQLQIIP